MLSQEQTFDLNETIRLLDEHTPTTRGGSRCRR